MASIIESVPGIGPKTAEFLNKHKVKTLKGLIKFGANKLKQAPGFGEARALAVIDVTKRLIDLSDEKPKKTKSEKKPKVKKEKNKKNKKEDKKKNKTKNKKKDKKKNKDKKRKR